MMLEHAISWISSDVISVRRGSKAEGFAVRLLRLRTVLVQQLLDTGTKVLSQEWLSNEIVTTTLETFFLVFKGGHCGYS